MPLLPLDDQRTTRATAATGARRTRSQPLTWRTRSRPVGYLTRSEPLGWETRSEPLGATRSEAL